jgi:hypothetical protein
MNDPNELFAIVPFSGRAPEEAIITGNLSQVTEYIPQSIVRNERDQQLAQAERDAEETERFHDEVRACAAQILTDGIVRLNERLDQFEARKAEREDQQRRDEEEAEAAAIEAELAALPDPDDPDVLGNPPATGDDGDFQETKPPPDTERYDPEGELRNEAASGDMPKTLDKGAPPQSGDYLSTTPPASPYRDPTSIGGN